MFIDASAIVAVLALEPGHRELAERIPEKNAITSPLAIYEATAAIVRKAKLDVSRAHALVESFLSRLAIEVVPIEPDMAAQALEAFAKYGKGRGHPAQLNMGDCFSYGMAKQLGVGLLYKGDDFAQTDLA